MNRTKSNQILCRPKKTAEAGSGEPLRQAVQTAVLFAAVFALLQVVSGPAGAGESVTFLLTGLVILAGQAVLRRLHRERWFTVGLLAALLLVTAVLGRFLTEGFCLWWNRVCETWTIESGNLLLGLQTRLPTGQHPACRLLFAAVTGAVLAMGAAAIYPIVNRYAAVPLLLALPAACFLGDELSPVWSAAAAACALLLLTLDGSWSGCKGSAVQTLLAAGSTLVIGALVFGLTMAFGAGDWCADWQEAGAVALHRSRYETEGTTLPEGSFSDYDPELESSYTGLIVTMEQPEELYLRGFVGDRFYHDRWTSLETARLAAEKERLYWLRQDGFRPQGQYARAAALTEPETNTVTVQNVNACSEFLYLPYQVQLDTCKSVFNEKALSVSAAEAAGFTGQRGYTYSIAAGAADLTEPLLEQLQTEEDQSFLDFRRSESSFRTFVYDYALRVPQSFLDLLGKELDDCCSAYGEAGELTAEEARQSALTFLETVLGDHEGEVIPLPLAEEADGSSYQYATVAALALRYYGIPARYAEGYIISEEMAREARPGESLSLDSSCAGAWVEVYQDGLGWMPMNVTPGFEALAGEQTEAGFRPVGVEGQSEDGEIGSRKGEGSGSYISEGEELENDENAEADETENEWKRDMKKTMVRIARGASWLILLALLLLPLIIWLRRRTILKKRQALFDAENPADGIAALYGYTAMLLRVMGLDRGKGSMEPVCDGAEERFGADYAGELRQADRLNGEALFSSHPMQEEQRQLLTDLQGKTLALLQKETKWYQRLKLRWLQCLY